MLGFYNISRLVIPSRRPDILNTLISDSFKGFCCVFFLGLALYLGYVSGRVPTDIYNRFTTLEQTAYGYSRFSPGTYPNEFGIICSFYAIYALLRSQQKDGSFFYLILSTIFMTGIFLTSTRAAYITLLLSYAYSALFAPSVGRRLILSVLPIALAPLVVMTLNVFSFDVLDVINRGYESAANQTGSSNVRLEDWNAAIDDLLDHLFFGVGFESPKAYSLHNLPLQIIYGLGLIGTSLLLVIFVAFTYLSKNSPRNTLHFQPEDFCFLKMIRFVLLIHVLIFGLTNHNQAHFFTWMLFSLYCLKLKKSRPAEKNSLANSHLTG